MKNGFYYIACTFLLALTVNCSTKKNNFLNRNIHTLSTKYNILYNGEVAFDKAKVQLDQTYEENYWKRLPIEPLEIKEEEIAIPGRRRRKSSKAQGFERAEEKAVKAVQKHSMVIKGHEKNSQIDEAYLLLGKSRYYSQRFVPALEAFTYVLEKYPNADLFNETRIWKAKTHIRLQSEELAIETLELVLKKMDSSDVDYQSANTAMAMAYTKLDSTHRVIEYLKKSLKKPIDRRQGARNLFILGQIYREQNKIDSSNMVFDTLAYIKRIPQKYKVHAILERAKNYITADSTHQVIYTLYDLIEDRDNREYLDELYYQAGLIALKNGYNKSAQGFFESSILKNKHKPFQKSLAYEQLGNMYFDDTHFEMAGSYYDSLLQIPLDKNTKRVRQIIKKRESLNDVIYYENIVIRNDSILDLTMMNPEGQKAFFEEYIDYLKDKDKEERKRNEIAEFNSGNGGTDGNTVGSRNKKGSVFYFYNTQLIGFGKQQFEKRYGNRPLADNWIISETTTSKSTKNKNKVEHEGPIANDEQKYDINFYLGQIPTKDNIIDSIANQRNDAYYNLGLIYKERFKEYELAATEFENFLNNNPPAKLTLPTKYHLYRCYENFNMEQSNKYRDEIVNNYPDSRYAQIILHPNSVLDFGNDENSPENVYIYAYTCYQDEEYIYALENINQALKKFEGLDIEVKFELLKAFLLFRTEGKEAFYEKLNEIILNYPNTEESEHAEKTLKKAKNFLKQDEINKD